MARFWPRVAYRFPIIARLAAVRARGERRPPDGLRLCLAAAEPRARPLSFCRRSCHRSLPSATTCRAFYSGHQRPATSSQLIHVRHSLFDRKCLSPHDWHMQPAIPTPGVAVAVATGADVQRSLPTARCQPIATNCLSVSSGLSVFVGFVGFIGFIG